MSNLQCPEDFLNDWTDGTPKSFGNSFTAHMDGRTSIFAEDRIYTPANRRGVSSSHAATQAREKTEADGKNIGTIFGLSKKVENTQQDARRYHVTVSQGAPA